MRWARTVGILCGLGAGWRGHIRPLDAIRVDALAGRQHLVTIACRMRSGSSALDNTAGAIHNHAQACIVGTCRASESAAGLQASRSAGCRVGVLQGGVEVNCTWRSAAVELHHWGRSLCLRPAASQHLRP